MSKICEFANINFDQAIIASQDAFHQWLLSQSKEDILRHIYEYTVRSDIATAAKETALSTAQKQVLLRSPDIVADVYRDIVADEYRAFYKIKADYMETLKQAFVSLAYELLEKHPDIIRDLPVFTSRDDNVSEKDLVESNVISGDCATAIDESIHRNYKNNSLDVRAAIFEVLKQFNVERVSYALACTICGIKHDARISPENREWAEQNKHLPDDPSTEFVSCTSHVGLINLFATEAQAVEKAILLINQFCLAEFCHEAEIDDLSNISLCACDSATDYALFAEVFLNLPALKIERWLNGVLVEEVVYKNMKELNDDLEALDIECLVSFSDAQIHKALEA